MTISDIFDNKNSEKLLLLGFSLFLLSIYLLFPTREFYWDGIIYAQFIEDAQSFGAHLFHPNHLFYNVLGYAAFNAVQNLGLQIRAIYVLQFVTTIFAVLCAVVFYLISKHVFRSSYLSFGLTALLAFSAAWWRFATDADVYIISVFFLLVAFYFVLPNKQPRPLIVAIAHSLGMFFHELAVLIFPAIVMALFFQTAALERPRRILIVLRYSLAAFTLTFGTYYLCFYLLTGTFDAKEFAGWVTSFAPAAGVGSNFSDSLTLTFRGHQKLFLDGSSRLFGPSFIKISLLAIFFGAAIVFLIKSARNFPEVKTWWKTVLEQKIYRRQITLVCAVWILPYLIFLFFFLPENIFYRLFYFPALIIFIGVILVPFEILKPKRRGRLALFVLVFALYNFLFYIEPNARVRENTPFAMALKANNVWSNKTVVFYVPTEHFDLLETKDRLVKYFNPAVAWKPLDSIKLNEFEAEILKIHGDGGDVWLSTLLVKQMAENPQTARWLIENSDSQTELNAPQANMKYVRIIPQSFGKD